MILSLITSGKAWQEVKLASLCTRPHHMLTSLNECVEFQEAAAKKAQSSTLVGRACPGPGKENSQAKREILVYQHQVQAVC